MPWTDEMVEDLKKMWEEGLSTGEIGKRLGVSKNSIVGKVHRLQLEGRPSPIKKKDETSTTKSAQTKPATKTQPKQTSPQSVEKPASKAIVKPVAKPQQTAQNVAQQPIDKPAVKAEQPIKSAIKKENDDFISMTIPVIHTPKKQGDKITVTDLDNHTCRWPIGDPKDENFHFCGAPIKIGQTYCEEHAAIAYVKNIKK